MPRWKLALWVAIVIATLIFLYLVRSILLPFVIAWLVAIVLEPAVRALRVRGWSRKWAVSFTTVVFFLFAFGAMAAMSAPLVRQLGQVQAKIQGVSQSLIESERRESPFVRWNPAVIVEPPGPLDAVDDMLKDVSPWLDRLGLPSSRTAIVSEYVEPQGERIAGVVTGFFNSFVGLIGTALSQILMLLLVPLLTYLMLAEMENLRRSVASWIPPKFRDTALDVTAEIGDVFKSYLRGVTLTAVLYAIVTFAVLSLLQVPYSLLLALLAGAVMIIPFIGQLITNLAIFLVAGLSGQTSNWFLPTMSPWTFALVAMLMFLAVSMIFDQVVAPKIIGQAVGLPMLAAIFVAMAGAAMFGLIGMIVAYPIAGAVKLSLERLLRITTQPAADTVSLPVVPLRHRQA